jgi:hypothetical protein
MSGIVLLMGLLLLSYAGSLLSGRHAKGTSSGIEFLALGILVGPHALGLVERGVVSQFSPIVQTALAWLGFVVGLDFGRIGGQRVPTRQVVLALALSALSGVTVAAAVYALLQWVKVPYLAPSQVLFFSAGVGAVLTETSRSAIEWVTARHGAKGPLSDLLGVVASADDLVPIAAIGVLFAFAPHDGVKVHLPSVAWLGVTALLGVVIAVVTAILLRDAAGYQVWGALGGTVLVALGCTARFGLSPMFGAFVLGATLAGLAPNARALRRLVVPTERPVLLPLLLLAGMRLDVRSIAAAKVVLLVLGSALVLRVLAKGASGLLLRATVPTAQPASSRLGLGLLSAGPITVTVGLASALRFSGLVGEALLTLAVSAVVIGEVFAPLTLRRELVRLGEAKLPEPAPSLEPDVTSTGDAWAATGEHEHRGSVPPAPASERGLS